MAVRTPASNLIRDNEQVKKGGSNLVRFGVTDDEADAIWGDRYSHPVNDIDDGAGEILIDNFYEHDFLVGSQWRIRAGAGGSSANSGLFTVASPGPNIDPSGGSAGGPVTKIPVEESLSAPSITDPVYFEPVQLAAGWHKISPRLAGGTITHDRDVERIFDETDSEVAEVVNSDEFTIARTALPNTEWFKLALQWLESNYAPVRDFLPLTAQGGYYVGNSGDTYGELRAYPYVSAQQDSYEEEVGRDAQRDHEVMLNATKAPDSNANAGEIVVPSHGATVVNMDDQTGWDGALSQFKDDAFTTSRTTS